MKGTNRIYKILLLSVTTALAGISAAQSTPAENSDSIESIHCYTADENRKIALLIKEGMEYRELYDVCEAQIKLMREQENLYRNVAENLEKAQVKADSAVVRLKTEHYEVMQANEKLKKRTEQ
jgi:hypothetical protein